MVESAVSGPLSDQVISDLLQAANVEKLQTHV